MEAYKCLNCDTSFSGNFCNCCGQKADVQRKITFVYAIKEIYFSLWAIDRSFFKYFIQILYKPGHLGWDWLNGKRKRYYNPISFSLLVGSIYGYLKILFNLENGNLFKNFTISERAEIVNNFIIIGLVVSITVFMISCMSLSSFILFRKWKLSFLDHLFIILIFLGGATIISGVADIINQFLFLKYMSTWPIKFPNEADNTYLANQTYFEKYDKWFTYLTLLVVILYYGLMIYQFFKLNVKQLISKLLLMVIAMATILCSIVFLFIYYVNT